MNKLKLTINKDIIYAIFVHFVCADIGFAYLLGFLYILLIITRYNDINLWAIADIPFIVIYIFVKLFCLIIYYNNDYKRVKNPLVIKLVDLLKLNINHSRLIFKFIITLPYNINTLFNMIVSYNWWYSFFEYTFFMYLASSFLSYKFLFYYWDILAFKNKTKSSFFDCIKYMLKISWLFIVFTIIIFVFMMTMRSPVVF